ncbi:MAG: hypothetical protein DWQ37_08485 [Planctomycetota bacterium]|nr:MAG: hypothetical protein DWQ37_08485 [Planctomycetota bacterium]
MHIIRLRGPWEHQPLVRYVGEGDAPREETDDLPAGGRTAVPGDWANSLGHDFIGCVRYTRRFNTPTNLDSDERVWLVVEAVDHEAEVTLNGQALGRLRSGQPPLRSDVTPLLAAYNQLVVDVRMPPAAFADPSARGERAGQAGGLTGEVRLEIGRT